MDIKTLAEKLQYVALYTAIAIIASFIVVGLLVWFFKREKFNDFKKYAIGIVTGFAATMLVVFSYVMFQRNINKMQAMLFYPILAMLIVVVAGGIAVLISSLFSNKAAKISLIVTSVLFLASFIALVVVVWKYYNAHFDEFKKDYPGMSLVGMVVSAVVILAVMVVLWFVGDKRKLNDTRSIVYGAVAMALAFVLSYARLFKLPNGGSITFASLLPLMIYCCMFGTRRGLIVCSFYGVLQALQDPYIIHPMQFLLDYPLAFGLVGVSGIFMEKGVFKEKKSWHSCSVAWLPCCLDTFATFARVRLRLQLTPISKPRLHTVWATTLRTCLPIWQYPSLRAVSCLRQSRSRQPWLRPVT